MARWKAHVQLSIRVNRTFFAIYYGSGVMRRNVYSSAVFAGVELFALEFYLDRTVPINHSWRQKTTDTWLSNSKDRNYTSAFSHFDTIPDCDG